MATVNPPILDPAPPWSPPRSSYVTLWHGCTGDDYAKMKPPARIDPTKGQPQTDFGRGFYTTTFELRARHWAWKRYYDLPVAKSSAGNQPVILKFRVPLERLARLNSLRFVLGHYDAISFWSLVQHCRQSPPVPNVHDQNHPDPSRGGWYDLVTGPVADFWRQRSLMSDADQFGFHTTDATDILNDVMEDGLRSRNTDVFEMIPVVNI